MSTPKSPFKTPRGRIVLWAVPIVVVVVLLAVLGMSWTPESGGSANADKTDTLYKIVLVVAAVVFVGVEGVLLWSLFKFKAREGVVAAQIRGNTRLEIGWTVGAAVILVVLAVVTFAFLPGIRNPPNSDPDGYQAGVVPVVDGPGSSKRVPPNGHALNITVNGQQYLWRFEYPDGDKNPLNDPFAYEQMVVPTKTTVTLDIISQDVAHSWWIPALGGKFDALPGYTNHTWFKIEKPGIYTGQCAELCGRNHANMIASVRAVTPQQFQQWLASKKQQIQQADDAAARSRQQDQSAATQGS